MYKGSLLLGAYKVHSRNSRCIGCPAFYSLSWGTGSPLLGSPPLLRYKGPYLEVQESLPLFWVPSPLSRV